MKALLVVTAMLLLCSISFAQLQEGKLAISTAVGQTNELGGSYALSESMRLNAGIGFSNSKLFGIGYGVDGSLWLYKPVIENITYFYGGGLNYTHSPGGTTKTISLNLVSGAEYWFNSRFAWGAYTGLNFSSINLRGTTSTEYGTFGIRTTLTWWFN